MIRFILTAALLLAGGPALSQSAFPDPLVIAHRGASGQRPEHTRAAYERAIEQGADFIEPDLVMTRDGHLVARHENEIGGTTDVADRPEFADRRATKTIDGTEVTGWFTEDFTLAELRTLRARERLPRLRPANTAFDGADPILTFAEVIAIAREAAARTGRPVGVIPELKHPAYFAAAGLPMEDAFVAVLEAEGWAGPDAPLVVQCFEVEPLRRLNARIEAPLVQLIAAGSGPWDRPDLTPARMLSPDGLAAIAAYADILGLESGLVIAHVSGTPTGVVENAHAAGLEVHVWTLRAENAFLPPMHRRGDDPAAHGDLHGWARALYQAGVDGVFSDFPGVAVQARTP
ncbi:MAG: glycerophosphodiester phosphodiesterase [Brevundimonas sp.]